MDEQGLYPELRGCRVLITGAGAGIGQAMAEAFAAEGVRLLLFDNDATRLAAVEAALAGRGAEVSGLAGSVADEREVEALMAAADARLGGVDLLINNAGISMNMPSEDLPASDWRLALDVNLTGSFLCAQAAGRRMLAQGRGVILNIASMYGLVAAPERLAYCVSKSGVVMLTRALGIEWAGRGVRVNAIAPGYIRTALVEGLVERGRLDIPRLERRTPQGRLGSVEEVAEVALFLASERAGFMVGQTVVLDGGWSAWGYV
ncbi:MAG TPA: SDR family NAD(P)-dependent oxidoreductase [Kiloniellales bacterium]|nr:SDR family NAD(P)-dependent oxidoreductase [Kiloniellales bacterium]